MNINELDYIEAIPDELYFKTISPFSLVYIDMIDDEWLVVRETHRKGESKPYSYRQIVKAKTLDYALKKAENYFKCINRKMK